MDSNNNVTKKSTTELDIRDIVNFLLSKLWIIALVILCFAIIAYLWTAFFVDKEYKSTTTLFITSNGYANASGDSDKQETADWSIGKQLTKTSSELIKGDYCDWVAQKLNEHDPDAIVPEGKVNLSDVLNNGKIMAENSKFSVYFSEFYPDGIKGSDIRSAINISSDDETCIVSLTATTNNERLSAAISNAVMYLYEEYINEFMEVKSIVTTISSSGKVPSSPSNANSTRNAVIFGAIGAILICAVLVVIFIFDDKIKTPDDIEKQLELSVLGAIPEIDEA